MKAGTKMIGAMNGIRSVPSLPFHETKYRISMARKINPTMMKRAMMNLAVGRMVRSGAAFSICSLLLYRRSAIPREHGAMSVMQIDRADTMETLSRLVQINSINPTLDPGAPGEREIADYIAAWLREAGLESEILEPEPGRTSVLGRLRGTGGGRALMLNAHV